MEIYYTVQFYVWDNTKGAYALAGEPQRVLGGNDAVPPTEYSREGYVFTGWSKPYTAISADETIYALYEPESENARKCKVVFKMPDGTEIETVYVDPGATVRAPGQDELEALAKNISSLNGKIFTGWQPALTNIQEDTVIWAIYADQPEDEFLVQYYDKDFNLHYQTTVKYGGATPNVAAPTVTGYTFKGMGALGGYHHGGYKALCQIYQRQG